MLTDESYIYHIILLVLLERTYEGYQCEVFTRLNRIDWEGTSWVVC